MEQANLTPNPAPAPRNDPGHAPGEVQAQLDSLRNLLNTLLVLTLVISGTLNIYFLRQYRNAKTDLGAIRPQATGMIAEYQKTSGPAMDEFIRKITDFGRTHADFAPIMNKYQLNKAASNAAPAAAAKKK